MNIIISNSSQEPIYEQIIKQIKEKIINGDVVENESLPSIRYLAKELRISVITTKRAYDELEKEGYIVTVPGKGTYVGSKNKELLKETQLKVIEDNLEVAVISGKRIGLTLNELYDMLKIIFEEE
jgi:Predicted transcriptional regulators